MPRVTFVSQGETAATRTVISNVGQTLLETAHAAGVEIVATCGASGRCRSCRIKILKGDVPAATDQDRTQLGQEEVNEQFRLACQTKVIGDCSVLVAPPASEVGYQVFVNNRASPQDDATSIDSGIEKVCVSVRSVTGSDEQISDAERALADVPEHVSRDLRLDVLRSLPVAIRERQGRVTFTAFNGSVIAVEPGDTRGGGYGMAFDVGTTTIVGSLLNLASGQRLATVANVNPQSTYGGDLMSRIAFAQSSGRNLATLQARVIQTLNDFIAEACREACVASHQIYKIVIVANPCMHHVLLGVDVTHLGLAPYAPMFRDALTLSAREIPLKGAPRARVCMLPLIAGFVGSDTVGALLSTSVDAIDGTRLLVDIGTNTEVVLASAGRLVACSAPAGPAFEGGQIRHGMRAAIGAIEAVEIRDDVRCRVIGDTPAIGICGSGLIDAVAEMRSAGLVGPTGLLLQTDHDALPAQLRSRFRETDQGGEFVLASAEQTGSGADIALTQADVRQFQLAKGAIYSAIVTLLRAMDTKIDEVDELLLCGGFGNYINLESAVGIRMLPPLGKGRIRYVGNAAHAGAEIALLSESTRARAQSIARRVAHVSLAEQADFQDVFVDALGI